MSVPVNLRKVPNTEAVAKFEAAEKCVNNFIHAVKCCTSAKVQNSAFPMIGAVIIQESLQIYLLIYKANRIPYRKGKITEENYNKRISMIDEALSDCEDLYGLVTLAKRCFSWRNSKLFNWLGMLDEAEEQIVKWRKWCVKEYKLQGQKL